jgi:hypothetical protein
MSGKMACPHCASKTEARFVETISHTVSEIVYRCEDDYCGHSFVARLETVCTLTPSKKPDPLVHIPLSARSKHAHAVRKQKLSPAVGQSDSGCVVLIEK